MKKYEMVLEVKEGRQVLNKATIELSSVGDKAYKLRLRKDKVGIELPIDAETVAEIDKFITSFDQQAVQRIIKKFLGFMQIFK